MSCLMTAVQQRQATYMLHPEIHNKPTQWKSSYVHNWAEHQDQSGTLTDLRAAVSRGNAFMPVRMAGGHKLSAAFSYADLAVVDIDSGLSIQEFLEHPLATHACWGYTSPSHGKKPGDRYRVIFRLPERISNPEIYKSLVSLLIRSLGGDTQCTDVCRYYNGNDRAEHFLWQEGAVLPIGIMDDATETARKRLARESCDVHHIDDNSIEQAIYVLHNVITPTADGERDRFIDVTKSCRAGGARLFPAWSDWASACHHGKGSKSSQTTEKFFYGFRGTGLGTLFFLANKENPDWRKDLPPELKPSGEGTFGVFGTAFAGYGHEDFLGYEEDYLEILQDGADTQNLFDSDAPWAQIAEPARPQEEELDEPDLDDEDQPEEDAAPRGRGRPSSDSDVITEILANLRNLFPGIRLNSMNQELEWGPKSNPKTIDDASTLYVQISAGTGKAYPKTLTHDTALVAGRQNAYHPVLDYLDHCQRNVAPCDYFDSIATTLLGVSADSFSNPVMPCGHSLADVIMKRFMVGAVARVIDPGCVHDWMPILIGEQNCGKTTFWQYLTPPSVNDPGIYPWVSTIQQGISYIKDRPHVLHAGWIVCMDECERFFKRKNTEEMKNLISTPVDRSARKYENERCYRRSFVLAACANSDELFVDPTGNRRFMPIRVQGVVPSAKDSAIQIIDLDRLKRDRDSLWSAAYKEYLDNPEHTFSSEEIRVLTEYMQSFTSDSPLEQELSKFCAKQHAGTLDRPGHKSHGKRYWLMASIFKGMDIPAKDEKMMVYQISDILKRRGFWKERIRKDGKVMNMWFNDDPFFNRSPHELGPDWD